MRKLILALLPFPLLFFGCSIANINKVKKETAVSTKLFEGNLQKMDTAFKKLKPGMTKEEIYKAGFDFRAVNVECISGAKAMPFITGDTKNNVDLSSEEKIDAYYQTISAYAVCLFPEQKLKSEKPRIFFSSRKEKTKGPDWLFMMVFKKNVLMDRQIITQSYRNKVEKESAFGGNVLDRAIGASLTGISKIR